MHWPLAFPDLTWCGVPCFPTGTTGVCNRIPAQKRPACCSSHPTKHAPASSDRFQPPFPPNILLQDPDGILVQCFCDALALAVWIRACSSRAVMHTLRKVVCVRVCSRAQQDVLGRQRRRQGDAAAQHWAGRQKPRFDIGRAHQPNGNRQKTRQKTPIGAMPSPGTTAAVFRSLVPGETAQQDTRRKRSRLTEASKLVEKI